MKNEIKESLLSFGKISAVGVLSSTAIYGIISGAEAIEAKIPATEKNSFVQYDGDKYKLDNLYVLISKEEKHICYLKEKGHLEPRMGITPEGKTTVIYMPTNDPSMYVDIKTKNNVVEQGYESMFGYEVDTLVDYVNLEDFDQSSKTLKLSEEKYELLTEVNESKGKTLRKII